MKSNTFALLFFFGSCAVASPHLHLHKHAARHANKEEENPVTWVTEIATKTVQVTATVWVTPSSEPTPVAEEHSVAKDEDSTNTPAQFFEPSPSHDEETPQADPEISSEVNYHPNDVVSTVNHSVEPTTETQGNSGENENISEPTVTEVKAPEPAELSVPAAAPPQVFAEAFSESNLTATHDHATAASCSSSSPCNGDITYYDPGVGYGSCGWKNTKNEPVVALPHEFMGPKSNGNSYCGKTITIVRDGKKSTARVVDKCMGCSGYSIDLSDAVFTQLASLSVGRTNAKWWVN